MALEGLSSTLSNVGIRVIAALIILLLGIILGRFLAKFIERGLRELEFNRFLKKIGVNFPLAKWISSLTKYVIYISTFLLVLGQLGLTNTLINFILIILLISFVVYLVLILKDFVPNFIYGFYVKGKMELKEGDRIEIENIRGEIESLGFTDIKLKTKMGDTMFIPNSYAVKKGVLKI